MATVSITHIWADGGTTVFDVEVDATNCAYLDALSEAKDTVLAMYRECVGITEPTGDDAPTT